MGKGTQGSRGFTLIASLLLLLLLSAIAVGLMYTVTGAGRVGSNDLEANTAYYGAESGMEKLTSDLLSLYQQKLSPTQTDLTNLAKTSPPSNAQIPGMTFLESANWNSVDPLTGKPGTAINVVSQGPYSGLTAEIIPMTLQVTAVRPFGASVSMTRGVEIALIPVFQFGVFSDSDLSYFAGPPFAFLGRVHTNGNLYLNSNSGPLVLGDKVTVAGQILRDRLANNFLANSTNGYFGDVYLTTSTGGCDAFAAAVMANTAGAAPASCVNFGPDTDRATNDSSWGQGIPTANGYANSTSFTGTISPGHFNNFAQIGVTPLQLPFVTGTAVGSPDTQIEIIREQETTGELPSSPIGASREYNKANIRILLADTQVQLHPDGRPNDNVNDIDLTAGGACAANQGLAWAVTGVGTTRFAMATTGLAHEPNWKGAPTGTACNPWNLVDGWLRVEYCNSTDCSTPANWIGVTKEWLNFGFARDVTPPTRPIDQTVVGKVSGTAGTNQTHPDAILIFQQRADRNAGGSIASPADDPSNIVDGGSKSQYSWYPINFFDPREGFPRDVSPLAGTQCYVNGIMNAVELDVGNFAKWVAGTGPYGGGTGKNVNTGPQNGYLVYFSDRRGELPNPNGSPANVQNGESGLEDVINSGSATGTPDGKLEASAPGYNFGSNFSPEDVDQDGVLDQWGAVNIGNGFGAFGISTADKNPFKAIDCLNGGRQNKVTGARHVLRLVDGGMSAAGNSYLPLPGFTVASENPVYLLGDYNSSGVAGVDSTWNTPSVDPPSHSAAAVIADAVTLLSNDWTDLNDLLNPNNLGGRLPARDTSFRLAIASGKNMNFPQVAGTGNDFGTDGGVHNFLRYIENLGNIKLNYRGSMVSMYYSEYATGIFKCCSLVYGPPDRNYSFDKDFLIPTNLPPGTPMLQDIDTLSYWQNFNPCTTQSGGNCTN